MTLKIQTSPMATTPSTTETVHSTTAPVVPRTPIEAPSAAIRKPGFASAMTKPSHHVIALRSCLSSTSADAIDPPSPQLGFRQLSYQLVQAGLRPSTTAFGRRQLSSGRSALGPGPQCHPITARRARPGPHPDPPPRRSDETRQWPQDSLAIAD